jgi:hypothetical protein
MSPVTRSQQPGATVARPGLPAVLRWTYRRASGRRRSVVIALDSTGVWFVYDLPAARGASRKGLLVERLGGYDDKLWQAVALAKDYLASQEAYRDSRRENCTCPDPLPRPTRVDLQVIDEAASRARRVVDRLSAPAVA